MGAIATFSWATFSKRFPEFSGLDEGLVDQYFAEASIFHVNDGTGPVKKAESQLILLNLVTAHIAQLNAPKPGSNSNPGSPQLVGAISSASEGSVSVSVTNQYPPGSPQWWQQTKYGAEYWALTAVYRTMHYRPNPGRNMNPFYPYFPRR